MAKPVERSLLQSPPPAAPPIGNKQTPLPTSEASSASLEGREVSCWMAIPKPLLYLVSALLITGGIYLLCHLVPFAVAVGLVESGGGIGAIIGIISIALGIVLAYFTYHRSPPPNPVKVYTPVLPPKKQDTFVGEKPPGLDYTKEGKALIQQKDNGRANAINALVGMLLLDYNQPLDWNQQSQSTCEDCVQALLAAGLEAKTEEFPSKAMEALPKLIKSMKDGSVIVHLQYMDGIKLVIVDRIENGQIFYRDTATGSVITVASDRFFRRFQDRTVIRVAPPKGQNG